MDFKRWLAALTMLLSMAAVGCEDKRIPAGENSTSGRPTVVATTNIMADVVSNLAGDQFNVVTIMPVGADPHAFQPSARQVAAVQDAAAIIANGAGLEYGLQDMIDSAQSDGVPVFEAISAVETVTFGSQSSSGSHGHDHEGDHSDELGPVDPHFFTDPVRMATSVDAIAEFLVTNVEPISADALRANARAYISELEALDAEVRQALSAIPVERRLVITNHEVLGYYGDRYEFTIVGSVITAGSTANGVNAQVMAELAEAIEAKGVKVILSDISSSDEFAQTLANEVDQVVVVGLFSESLGPAGSGGETYIEMVRTNTQRLVAAMAS